MKPLVAVRASSEIVPGAAVGRRAEVRLPLAADQLEIRQCDRSLAVDRHRCERCVVDRNEIAGPVFPAVQRTANMQSKAGSAVVDPAEVHDVAVVGIDLDVEAVVGALAAERGAFVDRDVGHEAAGLAVARISEVAEAVVAPVVVARNDHVHRDVVARRGLPALIADIHGSIAVRLRADVKSVAMCRPRVELDLGKRRAGGERVETDVHGCPVAGAGIAVAYIRADLSRVGSAGHGDCVHPRLIELRAGLDARERAGRWVRAAVDV